MSYEREFENAIIGMCGIHPTFNLRFSVFSQEIRFDYDNGIIVAPITERQPILGYFKRNEFMINEVIKWCYNVSSIY